jgi:hypothetical protein
MLSFLGPRDRIHSPCHPTTPRESGHISKTWTNNTARGSANMPARGYSTSSMRSPARVVHKLFLTDPDRPVLPPLRAARHPSGFVRAVHDHFAPVVDPPVKALPASSPLPFETSGIVDSFRLQGPTPDDAWITTALAPRVPRRTVSTVITWPLHDTSRDGAVFSTLRMCRSCRSGFATWLTDYVPMPVGLVSARSALRRLHDRARQSFANPP